ncbi:MAG: methyltransferase domain-containing protein [Candidatus Lokiarchaeota archaeon]|nr:methyltransferase domain-containing protein [Candidatus Lokiarchaeota archaeon]
MRKLEQEPDTYDEKFTALTKGVNIEVKDWILERIGTSQSILEVGCGTGDLASKIALKGNNVLAIDKNFQMINNAMKNYPTDQDVKLIYQIGTIKELPVEENSMDLIVSTFMLSELGPFEQQIFLRNSWRMLKPGGKILIGAEFVPSGFWKIIFKIKRWWFKKKLRRLRIPTTSLVKWFFDYMEPIGFKINIEKKWRHGSIKALELEKINDVNRDKPGYYRPSQRKSKGFRSQMQMYKCIFTGQVDHLPIEPGIYQSGKPNEKAPIIVTANYIYTYIKVMRALKGIDAWVLCVDSKGINVWCAARGDNFGNKQVIEAVEASGITGVTTKKTLILPQLSAGGVAAPIIKSESPDFPFNILYGPVWAKHLPRYLEDRPAKKPDKWKLAKFTLSHRLRAFITHSTFLLRKIFLKPTIGLLVLIFAISFLNPLWIDKFWRIGEIWLWILLTNALIAFFFPITKFTRCFIKKGIVYGILNVIILGGLTWFIHDSIIVSLWSIGLYFWFAFFFTMSFSGYSMETSPGEIQEEYPTFRKINLPLLIVGLILASVGFVLF